MAVVLQSIALPSELSRGYMNPTTQKVYKSISKIRVFAYCFMTQTELIIYYCLYQQQSVNKFDEVALELTLYIHFDTNDKPERCFEEKKDKTYPL